ncbi:MAG: hypothetical protein AB7V13_07260 [Pseudorhodoplanes sp.]|uniref:hypothetical protein n=1 Tax=Pseudorhodoplanes sp. TaxID=1934341 RepID=UPI003D132A16
MAHDQRRKGRTLRSALLALPLAALACACAQEQPSVLVTDPNVPPANYRTEILAFLRTYLNDPTGVRDASIGAPELRTIPASPPTPATQRYMVCLRFNARNSTGKYQGSRDYLAAFLAGRFDTLVPARKEQCAQTKWQPFPELETLRR